MLIAIPIFTQPHPLELKNILIQQMLLLRGTKGFTFSTAAAIAQKTFAKFTERYAANVQDFQRKVADTAAQGEQLKKSTLRAYVHPYNDPHKRVISGIAETLQSDAQLRGAEPVSPHYEHFSFARRQLLIFLGGLGVMRFIASTQDFFMFGQSATWAWTFYFAYSYFWLQGKKFFIMPFLTRFYRKLLNLELTNVETYWAENTEVRIRNLMSTAKEQIEYKSVHGDYLSIRNNTLLNFLISEQIALKNHVHSRAENLLREAQTLESLNENKIISGVMSEVLQSIDVAYKNNKEKIDAGIFELALEGIAKGKMDYANDPILPYVLETISKIVEKFGNISKEDQEKLVALSEDQLTALRNLDNRALEQYISTEPKIDGSLRNNPTVAKILQSWGK